MKFVPDREAARWLASLAGKPREFDWDQGNATKNEKHGLTPTDVESLLQHDFVLAGRITEPAHEEPRWLLLGCSNGGRLLALVFTRRGDKLRPISCRSMRKNERKIHDESTAKD